MLPKLLRLCPRLLAGLLCLGALPLLAQQDVATPSVAPSPTPTTSDANSGRIVSSDQVKQELDANDDGTLLDDLRAERAEYPRVSPEVRDKLREFNEQRDRYLREQQNLIKRFRGATDEERERIRNLLKERRRQWIERSRSIREDARRRMRDLIQELPRHREALEAARESVREELKDIRTRPRTD